MNRRSPTAGEVLSQRPSLAAINRGPQLLPHVDARPAAAWHRPHSDVPGGFLVWLPGLELVSELNQREDTWGPRHRRSTRQHAAVAAALALVPRMTPPCRVVITRCAPHALDSDNAVGAAKYVRDAVALWLGVDDANPRVEWVVRQEPPAGGMGVRIELLPRPAVPRTRVDLGARTVVRLRLTPLEREALTEALAHPDADEVCVIVEDLVLHLSSTPSHENA